MKTGKFLTPQNNEIAAIRFSESKKGYNFISTVYLAYDEQDETGLFYVGRFDFNYKHKTTLTNKGLSKINELKKYVIESINFMLRMGCEFVEIDAAPEKNNKRLLLYRRILAPYFTIIDNCNNNKNICKNGFCVKSLVY